MMWPISFFIWSPVMYGARNACSRAKRSFQSRESRTRTRADRRSMESPMKTCSSSPKSRSLQSRLALPSSSAMRLTAPSESSRLVLITATPST